MSANLIIAVFNEVYEKLRCHIAQRRISRFVDRAVRHHLVDPHSQDYWLNASRDELDRGYAEAAADVEREREAAEWCEALICETLDDEDFTDWPKYPPP